MIQWLPQHKVWEDIDQLLLLCSEWELDNGWLVHSYRAEQIVCKEHSYTLPPLEQCAFSPVKSRRVFVVRQEDHLHTHSGNNVGLATELYSLEDRE